MSEIEARREVPEGRPATPEDGSEARADAPNASDDGSGPATDSPARKRRRRGSRGGRKRSKARSDTAGGQATGSPGKPSSDGSTSGRSRSSDDGAGERQPDELPDRHSEGRPTSVEAADKALVRKASPPGAPVKPKIGDTMPAPPPAPAGGDGAADRGDPDST
ncbi:MAG: hypothetical protein ACRD2C_20170, partial [Acidimicrobiales bacterium]